MFILKLDRYVLLGNHRDAWTFGALDPSSGTASMIEIARVFGKLKREQSPITFLKNKQTRFTNVIFKTCFFFFQIGDLEEQLSFAAGALMNMASLGRTNGPNNMRQFSASEL